MFLIRVTQTPNLNNVFVAWFKCDQTEPKKQASIFVVISMSQLPRAVLDNKPEKSKNVEINFPTRTCLAR